MFNCRTSILSIIIARSGICMVLMMLAVTAFAQSDTTEDDTYITVDTVAAPYVAEEDDEEEIHFDSLTRFDVQQYQPGNIPDTALQRIKKDDAFWYANFAPRAKKTVEPKPSNEASKPFYLKQWFRTLVWIFIMGGFVAVLIWFLISSDIRLFRKKPAVVYQAADDDLLEDIFSIQYEHELEKAMADRNYPLAVRLMFLHTLKMLDDNGLIRYKTERTNSDYLMELYGTSYYNHFSRLTRNFEYVWYGKFDISAGAFDFIRKDYDHLKSMMP